MSGNAIKMKLKILFAYFCCAFFFKGGGGKRITKLGIKEEDRKKRLLVLVWERECYALSVSVSVCFFLIRKELLSTLFLSVY